MKIEKLEPMIPNEDGTPFNPYLQESYLMGTPIGSNLHAMFENFPQDECKYLIIINTVTGERIKITP